MKYLHEKEAEYLAKNKTLVELMYQLFEIHIRILGGGFNEVWKYRIPILKRAIIIKQEEYVSSPKKSHDI